jgi:nitrogen regulatory protein PII
MKIVTASVKPFKLDEVRDALTGVGVEGLTNTGEIGDSKIVVFGLDHAVRIRTGETDAAAL